MIGPFAPQLPAAWAIPTRLSGTDAPNCGTSPRPIRAIERGQVPGFTPEETTAGEGEE